MSWVLTPEQEAVLKKWVDDHYVASKVISDPLNYDPLRCLVEMAWEASYKEHKWDNYDSRDD